MPIIDYQGSRQVQFGTGDILVSPGILDMEQVVGVVCFTGNGTGATGNRTEHEPSAILEAEETPVRLTFEKVESIDVVIRILEETKALMIAKGVYEMNKLTANYSIFKVNDDYIVAETQEQAIKHHMAAVGPNWYHPEDELEVEIIPHDRAGRFETETGWEDKTFGEWLADFEYTGPQLLCWNE